MNVEQLSAEVDLADVGLVSNKKTVHSNETNSAIQFFFTQKQFQIG